MLPHVSTPQSIVLLLLGALGFYGLVHYFLPRNNKDKGVNWTPLEAVSITLLIYFASQIMAGIVIGLVAGLAGLDNELEVSNLESSAVFQFSIRLLFGVFSIGLLHWFMKRRRTAWQAIGWVRPRLRDVGYALAGFGVYFLTYALIVYSLIQTYLPQVDTKQPQELGFNTSAGGIDLVYIFLALVILPPLVEEILVRGFLFTGLKSRLALLPAALVTSLVFAAAHLQAGSGKPLLWTAAADTFVLSMVLVFIRHKTGSLWPGIGVHFIKNGIAFLALFIFKVT